MLMGRATQVDGKQRRNNKEKREEEIDGRDYRADRWKNINSFVAQWEENLLDGVYLFVFHECVNGGRSIQK